MPRFYGSRLAVAGEVPTYVWKMPKLRQVPREAFEAAVAEHSLAFQLGLVHVCEQAGPIVWAHWLHGGPLHCWSRERVGDTVPARGMALPFCILTRKLMPAFQVDLVGKPCDPLASGYVCRGCQQAAVQGLIR